MRQDHEQRPEQRSPGIGPGTASAGESIASAAAVAAGAAAAVAAGAAAVLVLGLPAGLGAQEGHGGHTHQHGEQAHGGSVHFVHPMIAETVTPDTKVRFDHQYFEFPDGTTEHSGVLEAEYAFGRVFSIEASFPYSYSETEEGNAGVMLKFANYALEESGVVLGYGVDMTFPTAGPAPETGHEHEHGDGGHTHELVRARRSSDAAGAELPGPSLHTGGTGVRSTLGSHEWQVGPYLDIGWKSGPVELMAWSVFQIPFDHHEQAEVGTELAWNVSGLYHVSPRVQALLELDGSGGISGPSVGEDAVNLSPGLRVQVLPDTPLVLGTSVGFPLANHEPFDLRWKSSVFYHFGL